MVVKDTSEVHRLRGFVQVKIDRRRHVHGVDAVFIAFEALVVAARSLHGSLGPDGGPAGSAQSQRTSDWR